MEQRRRRHPSLLSLPCQAAQHETVQYAVDHWRWQKRLGKRLHRVCPVARCLPQPYEETLEGMCPRSVVPSFPDLHLPPDRGYFAVNVWHASSEPYGAPEQAGVRS